MTEQTEGAEALPVDSHRQFLAERDVILCRTCLRPLTWETRTEPGFLPRQGWYDDARSDPLVCFRAADYRHVPLTDREWAYYEAGRASGAASALMEAASVTTAPMSAATSDWLRARAAVVAARGAEDGGGE